MKKNPPYMAFTGRKRVSPRLSPHFILFLNALDLNEFGQAKHVANPHIKKGTYNETYYENDFFIIRPHDIFFSPAALGIPNFVDKRTGLEIYWYRKPLNSAESNSLVTSSYIEEILEIANNLPKSELD